jgi:hypothetical protein
MFNADENVSRKEELLKLLDQYFNVPSDLNSLVPQETIDGMIAELRRDYGIFYSPSRDKYSDPIRKMLKKSYNIDSDDPDDTKKELEARFKNVSEVSDKMFDEMTECRDYVIKAFNLPDSFNWKDVEKYFKDVRAWKNNEDILFDIFDVLEKDWGIYSKSADGIRDDLEYMYNTVYGAASAQLESMERCRKDVCSLLGLPFTNETTWVTIEQKIENLYRTVDDIKTSLEMTINKLNDM